MQNSRRFKLKFLGVLMETDNLTAADICRIINKIGLFILVLIIVWRMPDLIHAIR